MDRKLREQNFDELIDMFTHAPIGLCVYDQNLRYVQINDCLAKINGVPVEQHFGRAIREVVPNVAASVELQLRQVLETGEPFLGRAFEAETPAQPGIRRTFQDSYYAIKNESGTVIRIACVVQDVTLQKRAEEELRESELRYRTLATVATVGIFHTDAQGLVTYVNEKWCEIGGITAEEAMGAGWLAGLHPEDRESIATKWSAFARNQTTFRTEYRYQRPDGVTAYCYVQAMPETDADGKLIGYVGCVTDITERKRAEEALQEARDELELRVDARTKELHDANQALRESNERLQRLVESTMAIPWEADARTWQFTYVGPQAEKLLGYPCERWLESDFWVEHIHPEDREYTIGFCQKSSKELDDYQFDYRLVASDGRSVWFHDIVKVMRHDGKPAILSGFMIDITARKRMEEELQNLSSRLIYTQEEERKRIARELHDDFNQRLALLTIDIEQLVHEHTRTPEDFDGHVRTLVDRIKDLSVDVHRLSHSLHPAILDHLGLVAAVRSLCREMSVRHDLRIRFSGPKLPDVVPNDVALCCYRIVQEALRNVIKHSGAREAHVELTRTKQRLELHIRDQGAGFDVAETESRGGLGFTSMRERLRLVGGRITIKSSVAHGTEIDVLVPLSAADAE